MRNRAWVFGWMLGLGGGIASAQPAPPTGPSGPMPGVMPMTAPPIQQHEGLYLRLMVGGGYSQLTNTQTDSTGATQSVKIHGGGVALDIHIGYFVAPNFALGADLYGAGIPGPTVTINGTDMQADPNSQLNFTGIAAGVTYFVPEPNVYFAASIGAARATVQEGGQMSSSPDGWGLHLLAGKEWWVSPHWGVGGGVDFFRMTLPDNGIDDTVYGAALLFSSSYSGG